MSTTRRSSRRPKNNEVQDENKKPDAPKKTTPKTVAKKSTSSRGVDVKDLEQRIQQHIDPYSKEMNIKFEKVEGSNVQEIVFLAQENQLAQRKILEQAESNTALQKELADLKARISAGATMDVDMPLVDSSTNSAEGIQDGAEGEDSEAELNAKVDTTQLSDELEKARAANAALEKRLAAALQKKSTGTNAHPEAEKIPKPPGTAGTDFNIQVAMGLGESVQDRQKYLALLRYLRELTHTAGINWEQHWAKIPVGAKEKLFASARERHPILKDYENDWATEEIVKQFIKNKRRTGYTNGWLEPPEGYSHLKTNSAKRNPSAPRGSRAKFGRIGSARVAKKTATKEVAAKKAATKSKKEVAAKRVKAKKAASKEKSKKAAADDDEDSMSDGSSDEEGSYDGEGSESEESG